MAESQVSVPTTLNDTNLADWAESAIFIEGRNGMSRAKLRRRLKDSTLFDTDEDSELDIHLDLLLDEIDRRSRIAPDSYPFRQKDGLITKIEAVDSCLYEFLLWISVSSLFRSENRHVEVEAPFDELVRQAMIGYLGPGSQALRFARLSGTGRPTNFKDAVVWLADQLNLPTGASIPRSQINDGGLDIVAWRGFRDSRSGFSVILVQCTIQKDWVPKAKDIVLDKWRGWIDFGKDPSTALAIPFAISLTFNQWDETRRTVNMVLDRFRLLEMTRPANHCQIEVIRDWAQNERNLLGGFESRKNS